MGDQPPPPPGDGQGPPQNTYAQQGQQAGTQDPYYGQFYHQQQGQQQAHYSGYQGQYAPPPPQQQQASGYGQGAGYYSQPPPPQYGHQPPPQQQAPTQSGYGQQGYYQQPPPQQQQYSGQGYYQQAPPNQQYYAGYNQQPTPQQTQYNQPPQPQQQQQASSFGQVSPQPPGARDQSPSYAQRRPSPYKAEEHYGSQQPPPQQQYYPPPPPQTGENQPPQDQQQQQPQQQQPSHLQPPQYQSGGYAPYVPPTTSDEPSQQHSKQNEKSESAPPPRPQQQRAMAPSAAAPAYTPGPWDQQQKPQHQTHYPHPHTVPTQHAPSNVHHHGPPKPSPRQHHGPGTTPSASTARGYKMGSGDAAAAAAYKPKQVTRKASAKKNPRPRMINGVMDDIDEIIVSINDLPTTPKQELLEHRRKELNGDMDGYIQVPSSKHQRTVHNREAIHRHRIGDAFLDTLDMMEDHEDDVKEVGIPNRLIQNGAQVVHAQEDTFTTVPQSGSTKKPGDKKKITTAANGAHGPDTKDTGADEKKPLIISTDITRAMPKKGMDDAFFAHNTKFVTPEEYGILLARHKGRHVDRIKDNDKTKLSVATMRKLTSGLNTFKRSNASLANEKIKVTAAQGNGFLPQNIGAASMILETLTKTKKKSGSVVGMVIAGTRIPSGLSRSERRKLARRLQKEQMRIAAGLDPNAPEDGKKKARRSRTRVARDLKEDEDGAIPRRRRRRVSKEPKPPKIPKIKLTREERLERARTRRQEKRRELKERKDLQSEASRLAKSRRLAYRSLCRVDIPRAFKEFQARYNQVLSNARKISMQTQKEVKKAAIQRHKDNGGVPLRAKKLVKQMLRYWRHAERQEKEVQKRQEKEDLIRRRAEEELREAKRQQRKLNFLITQTELYAHFVGAKVGTAAAQAPEAKSNSNGGDVEPQTEDIAAKVGGEDPVKISENEILKQLEAGMTQEEIEQAKQEAAAVQKEKGKRQAPSRGLRKASSEDSASGDVRNDDEADDEDDNIELLKQKAIENAKSAIDEQKARTAQFDAEYQAEQEAAAANAEGGTESTVRKAGRTGALTFDNPQMGEGYATLRQPKMFNGTMKGYQLKGISWLYNLYDQGINGILADEMGLGKTVQSIALLCHIAETQNIWGPFLVIAPASTLHNWLQEFKQFAPTFQVLPYWGNIEERKVLRKFWNHRGIYTKSSACHVVVTNYQLVVSDANYFQRVKWQYMILDEAQAIKSSSSIRWKTLLGFNCRNRLLLTGTPIQNSMAELWALLHFIMPSLFDSHKEFSEWFSKDIEATATDQKGGIDEAQLRRLHMILKPFMLRRVKTSVDLELPDKIEIELNCGLSARQMALYTGIRKKISIEELLDTALEFGNQTTEDNNQQVSRLMNLVMQFRKVCNHPDLFERREPDSPFFFSPELCHVGRRNIRQLREAQQATGGLMINTTATAAERKAIPASQYPLFSCQTDASMTNPSIFATQRSPWNHNEMIWVNPSVTRPLTVLVPRIVFEQAMTIHRMQNDGFVVPSTNEGRVLQRWIGNRLLWNEQYVHNCVMGDSQGKDDSIFAFVRLSGLTAGDFVGCGLGLTAAITRPVASILPQHRHSSIAAEGRAAVALLCIAHEWSRKRAAISTVRDTEGSRSSQNDKETVISCGGTMDSTVLLREITSTRYSNGHNDANMMLKPVMKSDLMLHALNGGLAILPGIVSGDNDAFDLYTLQSWSLNLQCTLDGALAPVPDLYASHPRGECHAPLSASRAPSYQQSYAEPTTITDDSWAMFWLSGIWYAPAQANRRRLMIASAVDDAANEDANDRFMAALLSGDQDAAANASHEQAMIVAPMLEHADNDATLLNPSRRDLSCHQPLSCPLQVPEKRLLISDAGKLRTLDRLLVTLKNEGHRTLLYSQMTRMIDLLEEYLTFRQYKYIRLDGSSKISDRRDMVSDFQTRDDIFVFLLSTRAGGLGINLTAADTVIFYDSDWNPTVDQQAMDRAHRVGQTKQVTVYRMVTKGSIEDRILQRARQKSQIQSMVISGSGSFKGTADKLVASDVVNMLLDDDEMERNFRKKQKERKAMEKRRAAERRKRRKLEEIERQKALHQIA
eukprot:Clim_evm20s211 gene=Clim_evmTU20s211